MFTRTLFFPYPGVILFFVLVNLFGCSMPASSTQSVTADQRDDNDAGQSAKNTDYGLSQLPSRDSYAPFRAYGRLEARTIWNAARSKTFYGRKPSKERLRNFGEFNTYGAQQAELEAEPFFKGRYNRSRAKLPENIEKWRSRPDIANPGPDLANFPNSPFTLPRGRAYVEIAPFTYSGTAINTPEQYNTEYLLRYGLTEQIELRLFGNGVSWIGGSNATSGFSPIGFDTKILLWPEIPDYLLPAVGFEASLQTEWLGSSAFNSGTQPSFTLNFDQSMPYEIDLGYSFSATRFQNFSGNNAWAFQFQWALQHDLFEKDFAVFVHGFYERSTVTQNAVGGGFVWTVNQRFAVYGQASGGTTGSTPSLLSNVGFAIAF